MVVEKFGNENDFKMKVNPDTQISFGQHPVQAVNGDYPTLNDICIAYGDGFSAEWIIPHLVALVVHTGAKNLSKEQLRELSKIIAAEYKHLKVTELLLFFYRFKAGMYGRFYGTVDPMVITCALRDFMQERSEIIRRYETEKAANKISEELHSPDNMSREEYNEIKMLEAMYYMETKWNREK